MNNLIYL